MITESDFKDLMNTKDWVWFQDEADISKAKHLGRGVYYFDQKYKSIDARLYNVKGAPPSNVLNGVIFSFCHLNQMKSIQDISKALSIYFSWLCYGGRLTFPHKRLEEMVDYAMDNLDVEKCYKYKRFLFTKRIPLEEKRVIMQKAIRSKKAEEGFYMVLDAVNEIMQECQEFVCAKTISDRIGGALSNTTIYLKLKSIYDDLQVGEYNLKNFGTESWIDYNSHCMEQSLEFTYNVLKTNGEKITVRKLAKEANVSAGKAHQYLKSIGKNLICL